jgi:hypothetical protein
MDCCCLFRMGKECFLSFSSPTPTRENPVKQASSATIMTKAGRRAVWSDSTVRGSARCPPAAVANIYIPYVIALEDGPSRRRSRRPLPSIRKERWRHCRHVRGTVRMFVPTTLETIFHALSIFGGGRWYQLTFLRPKLRPSRPSRRCTCLRSVGLDRRVVLPVLASQGKASV